MSKTKLLTSIVAIALLSSLATPTVDAASAVIVIPATGGTSVAGEVNTYWFTNAPNNMLPITVEFDYRLLAKEGGSGTAMIMVGSQMRTVSGTNNVAHFKATFPAGTRITRVVIGGQTTGLGSRIMLGNIKISW